MALVVVAEPPHGKVNTANKEDVGGYKGHKAMARGEKNPIYLVVIGLSGTSRVVPR